MADCVGAVRRNAANRLDLLGVNRLGRALLSDLCTHGASRPNLARYLFPDPRSQDFYVDWAAVATPSAQALQFLASWANEDVWEGSFEAR